MARVKASIARLVRLRVGIPLPELFSVRGRITRVQFIAYCLGLLVLLLVFPIAVEHLLNMIGPPNILDLNISTTLSRALILTAFFLGCLMIYVVFCVTAKRLHDIGLPAVVGILLFTGSVMDILVTFGSGYVPLDSPLIDDINNTLYGLAFLLFLALCVWPGKKGENRYGSDPSPDEAIVEADEA